ncbi:uncharacterized protein PGTG_10730 [Puccinia graminis f. sp. tritici CRL 75-36-700-3]|uniref:Uncharacterized protein n=1 Tax=Puccinia graminis f. sp. tritici (strain CRL 75-36-700-3 / race SCCL) TaxID=418459 RepID=E3KJU6_PUCGT|nr:uncharacterized protein PGTG_10730 [Puccinia graminis f. sp. tritici CRL 75-36-700-3]EFP84571.1 hypothetical protein PGTG_10730 [Puccinia graminis f. sp. tritici CRL 75-36-700-3]
MQHQIIILLLVSLAAFSQSANPQVPQVKLPDSFTCKAAIKGKETSHTFQAKECTKAIDLLAKGKAPSAACGQCLLGLVGEDGNAFTPTHALDSNAILTSVKNIADGCNNSAQSKPHNQKRDNKPSGNDSKSSGSAPPKIQVVLGLPKEKAQC